MHRWQQNDQRIVNRLGEAEAERSAYGLDSVLELAEMSFGATAAALNADTYNGFGMGEF